MIDIVTDASERSLADAIERSLWETWRAFASSPRLQLEEDSLLRFTSGVPRPAMNAVMRARLQPARIDPAIESTIAFYGSRGLPFTWWTGPQTQPDDLGARLLAHGLASHDTPLTGGAMDLTKLNWIGGSPAGFTVEIVQDAEGYRTLQDVQTRGAHLPADSREAMCEMICDVGFGEEAPLLHYLGRVSGRPIATAMLSLAGGIAGVYDVVTLPEENAQGLEMAMALMAFLDARDMDFRIGVMQCSHLAFNSLRHLGLQEYCEIERYVWTPPQTTQAGPGEYGDSGPARLLTG